MEKNKPNNLMIGLLIVCLILIIGIIITMLVLSNNKDSDKNKNSANGNSGQMSNTANNGNVEIPEYIEEEHYINKNIHKVYSDNEYFTTEKNIKNLVLYSKVNNETAINSLCNGSRVFSESDAKEILRIKEMNAIDNESGSTYFVEAELGNNIYYIAITNDYINSTFQLTALSKDNYDSILKGEKDDNYTSYIEVNKNEYNTLQYVNYSLLEIVQKYFESYIQNARYNPEEAYQTLDEEYKSARFGNYANYRNYLTDSVKAEQLIALDSNAIKNANEFATPEEYSEYILGLSHNGIKTYKMYTEDDGTEYYVCADGFNNYYIFRKTYAMEYELILDTYTLELPIFIAEYDKTEDEGKTKLHVQRFFEALNNKDYSHIYSKISDEIKEDIFTSEAELKEYLTSKFFEINKMEFGTYDNDEDEGLYKISVMVSDMSGKSEKEVNFVMVIELGGDMDYRICEMIFE